MDVWSGMEHVMWDAVVVDGSYTGMTGDGCWLVLARIVSSQLNPTTTTQPHGAANTLTTTTVSPTPCRAIQKHGGSL